MLLCMHWYCALVHAVLMPNGIVHIPSLYGALAPLRTNASRVVPMHLQIRTRSMCRCINVCRIDDNVPALVL